MDRYRYFKRASGVYYCFDKTTSEQSSLKTKDKATAIKLVQARNETARAPLVNRALGRAYISASDPSAAERTWADVVKSFRAFDPNREAGTLERLDRAAKAPAMRRLLPKLVIQTTAEDLLKVISSGGVSVNVFLRRWYRFADDMGWLPGTILPPRRWPKIRHGKKRAITQEEHLKLLEHIKNAEWKDFLVCLWWTGASQGDLATLTGPAVNLEKREVCFDRMKVRHQDKGWVYLKMGPLLHEVFSRRWNEGYLFPYLAPLRASDRATYFARYCERAGVAGEVTLHSYRYAVAQRMRSIGFNSRYAEALVGHSGWQIHQKYAMGAEVVVPSLEDAEKEHQKAGSGGKQA